MSIACSQHSWERGFRHADGVASISGKPISIRCVNGLEEFRKWSVVVDSVHLSPDMKGVEKTRENAGMMSHQPNFFPYLLVSKNCTPAPMLTIFKASA